MSAKRQASPSVPDLAQRLHAVAIRLLRRARREDAMLGLPPGQASALSVLVFGGARTLSELAAIEQVQPPTMTRMVDALEKAGLVARQQDAADRRRFRISASPAGVRLMHKGRERRVAALAGLLARTDRDQRATLLAALDILERVQRDPHG
jgi:DNA-binding MarR family transcriptional regulator